MEFTAISRYIRVSPRKMQLVVKSVRSLSAQKAKDVLSHMPKNGADSIAELIASAMAQAKQKQIDGSTLSIEHLYVTKGPSMKRFRAVSKGSAHTYKKRMTHVKVILTDVKKETKSAKKIALKKDTQVA